MHRAILSLSQNNLNVQLVISESRKLRIAVFSNNSLKLPMQDIQFHNIPLCMEVRCITKKRWLNLRENLPIICLSLLNYAYAYGCEG